MNKNPQPPADRNQPQPPKGYRFRTNQDDIFRLHAARQTGELCTCGHAHTEHAASNRREPCLLCNCTHFTFRDWLIRLP